MGGDARQAVIDEDKKRNITVNLPPQVSFGSRQWPTLITPGSGPKPSLICLKSRIQRMAALASRRERRSHGMEQF